MPRIRPCHCPPSGLKSITLGDPAASSLNANLPLPNQELFTSLPLKVKRMGWLLTSNDGTFFPSHSRPTTAHSPSSALASFDAASPASTGEGETLWSARIGLVWVSVGDGDWAFWVVPTAASEPPITEQSRPAHSTAVIFN